MKPQEINKANVWSAICWYLGGAVAATTLVLTIAWAMGDFPPDDYYQPNQQAGAVESPRDPISASTNKTAAAR